MRQVKCDNCGAIDKYGVADWITLRRPYQGVAPAGYALGPGIEEFDFCAPACVVAFLTQESE